MVLSAGRRGKRLFFFNPILRVLLASDFVNNWTSPVEHSRPLLIAHVRPHIERRFSRRFPMIRLFHQRRIINAFYTSLPVFIITPYMIREFVFWSLCSLEFVVYCSLFFCPALAISLVLASENIAYLVCSMCIAWETLTQRLVFEIGWMSVIFDAGRQREHSHLRSSREVLAREFLLWSSCVCAPFWLVLTICFFDRTGCWLSTQTGTGAFM